MVCRQYDLLSILHPILHPKSPPSATAVRPCHGYSSSSPSWGYSRQIICKFKLHILRFDHFSAYPNPTSTGVVVTPTIPLAGTTLETSGNALSSMVAPLS